jgi:hypothetical protein
MKKIFFFEKLNFFNFIFIILIKCLNLRSNIYFKNRSSFFKNNSSKLKFLNLQEINYTNLRYKTYIENLCEKNILEVSKVLKDIKKTSAYEQVISYFNLKDDRKVFDITLSNIIAGNYLYEGVITLELLKIKFKNTYKIYYFPETFGNYLVSKNYTNHNIIPIKVIIFTKNLIKFFFEACQFKLKKKFKKKNFKYLFCPHNNFKYGSTFKKNFLFKFNQRKKFKNNDFLIMDKFEQTNLTKRYIKLIKSEYVKINKFKIFNFFFFLEFIKILNGRLFVKIEYNLIMWFLFNRIKNYIKILDNFKKLKKAIFHFDILVDQSFLLACKIKKIKTISFQERFSGYSFTPYLFFDEYYASGEEINFFLKKNFYYFKKIYYGSLPRAELIKVNDNVSAKHYIELLNLQKLILCFDPPYLSSETLKNYGEIFSNEEKRKFYELIIELSLKYKNYKFIIKPKFFSQKDKILMNFAKRVVQKKYKNIIIIKDNFRFNTYKLASISDLVFGEYSSIFDECFSVGKKILIYSDVFNYINHPLIESEVFCKNRDEVIKKFDRIFNSKDDVNNKIYNLYKKVSKNENIYSQIIKELNKN